ncbi:MAG: hypothetical protein CML46_18250 [Rhodobacteraceae bacterium]|nr:hypothetical protein [Paracoccaceae bacterium]MBR28859.1 hypothetical protein [Paracoccaceae bacterium]
MRMLEIDFDARPPVEAYGGGGFRIGGEKRMGSQLLLPGGMADWPVAELAALGPEALAPILAAADDIDVLLLGAGADVGFPPREARAALEAAGVGLDPMSTPAACRTFNVLLAEGRRVAAALIAV